MGEEARTQRRFIEACKREKLIASKIDASVRGWPDVVVIFAHARTWWVEFKRRGERPTAQQNQRIYALRARGHDVSWFDNLEDALDALEARLTR